jgi:hypothetical protein
MDATTVTAQKIISEFVEAEYPTSTGLLLFGSQATGLAQASSDIDACLLLPRVDRPVQLSREHRGRAIDLHIYDLPTLQQVMQKQRKSQLAHIATWLRAGTILKDTDGSLQRARMVAGEILDGPRDPVDWRMYRTSITNLMRHVRTSRDEFGTIACLNALYRMTTNLILLRAGRWLQSPTEVARELQAVDAALCARLHQAFREAILGTPAGFLRLVESELEPVGGTTTAQRHVA